MTELGTSTPTLFITLILINIVLGILNISVGNKGSGRFSIACAVIICVIALCKL